MTMTYKGVKIEPRILELVAGGFGLEVWLLRDLGSAVTTQKISTLETFDRREKAEQLGLRIGMDAVDGKIEGV